MTGFNTMADLIAAGKEFGIFEFYLPFILMFTVLYGILMKSGIFGTGKGAKNINLIVSLVASLFVMAYTPVGITFAAFLSNLFGKVLVVLVTVLALLMMMGLLLPAVGVEMQLKKGVTWVVIFIILLALGVFVSSGGVAFFPGLTISEMPIIPSEVLPGLTPQDVAMALMFGGTLIIVWLIHQSGEEKVEKKKYLKVPVE